LKLYYNWKYTYIGFDRNKLLTNRKYLILSGSGWFDSVILNIKVLYLILRVRYLNVWHTRARFIYWISRCQPLIYFRRIFQIYDRSTFQYTLVFTLKIFFEFFGKAKTFVVACFGQWKNTSSCDSHKIISKLNVKPKNNLIH
jgi:hypothetical protein